jgi:peptidoglycan-N-acetylglucosamine deacetylase
MIGRITLTFDNGPTPEITHEVLDTLARNDLRATFCVLGHKIATSEGRACIERAHAEGHWLANHSWSHQTPLGLMQNAAAAIAEVADTQSELGDLSHPDRFFRPFGGGGHLDHRLLRPEVVDHLIAGRYTLVLWNAVPRDWVDADGWVDTALAQCRAQDWTQIVLHDLPGGAMTHLESFLHRARDEGAEFVQAHAPSCTPLLRGRIVSPLEPYTAAIAA